MNELDTDQTTAVKALVTISTFAVRAIPGHRSDIFTLGHQLGRRNRPWKMHCEHP